MSKILPCTVRECIECPYRKTNIDIENPCSCRIMGKQFIFNDFYPNKDFPDWCPLEEVE